MTNPKNDKKVPASVARALLSSARGVCFIHRIAWVRVVPGNKAALKFQPLDLHHVEFRSMGGSNDTGNLIPLCPNCHRLLHDSRRSGEPFLSDDELRSLWALWLQLPAELPTVVAVGQGEPRATAKLVLNVYGLVIPITADDRASYHDAREAIVDQVVEPLRTCDPHFPFVRMRIDPYSWQLTTDAGVGTWKTTSAADVFASQADIQILAPLMAALSREARWLLSRLPHHRPL